MPDGVSTVLRLPYDEKIVVNRRSTTTVLNMTKTVVDVRDLSRPTKTPPGRCPRLIAIHHAYYPRGESWPES